MAPISAETRQPVQVERKAPARKAKAKEIAKKVIPKETREWLIKAGRKLQHKDGRKSLEVLATPPPTTLEDGEKKDIPTVAEKPVDEKPATESGEKSNFNLRYQKLQSRISEIKGKTNSIIEVRKSIFDVARSKSSIEKQQLTILEGIKQSLVEIRKEHIAFINEALQDKQLLTEVREAYMEDFIIPEIDRLMKEEKKSGRQKINKTKKQDFLKTLRTSFDMDNLPEDRQILLKQKMDKFIDCDGGFNDLKEEVKQNLLGNKGKYILRQILNDQAANNFKDFEESLHLEGNQGINNQVYRIVQEVMELQEVDENHSYINNSQIQELDIESEAASGVFIKCLKSMEKSQSLTTVYGERLSEVDNKIYQALLDKSLSDKDGGYIDSLVFYPTPDAIRNLVIIAAADSQEYRTVHANWSLSSLSKRFDWKQHLDEAEKVYPSLKATRSVLESWDYGEHDNHPDIQQAAGDLAPFLFEGNPVNGKLTELATTALLNHSIMDILTRRGVIQESEVVTLKEAESFLKRISEESWQKRRENDSIPYIEEYTFRTDLRKNLFELLQSKPGEVNEQQAETIRRFGTLSRKILDNQQDYQTLSYLASGSVIEKLQDPSLKPESIMIFLEAYKTVPALISNRELRVEFCKQFTDEQSVAFFRDMSVAYQSQEEQFKQIVELVGKGVLTKERALELPTKAKDVLVSPAFSVAVEFPQLYLETDDGLDFFTQSTSGSLFSLDKGLETRVGERIRTLQREGNLRFSELLVKIVPREIEQIDKLLSSGSIVEAGQLSWQQLLMGFVRSQNEVYPLPKLSQISADRINTLFNDPKVRDTCLQGLRDSWLTYLKSGRPEEIPLSLNLMSEFISYCGSAGPLSQVESLNSLISSVNKTFSKETTVERTKLEISQGLVSMEERFAKERWSNEDRTDFYNISRDILGAAPSIFSDYLSLFGELSPSQMRQFSKEIYPLYRTKLVLMERKDEHGHKTYGKEQLIDLRRDIRNFADVFNAGEKPFETQKGKLLEEITGLFKDHFGIIKIPESFTAEHMRSFTNVSTYLANLHDRKPEKENVLGFYLALKINNRWDDFRKGVEINPAEYLTTAKSKIIKTFLSNRQRLNPLTSETLGITQEELPEFYRLLQQESQSITVGNIETIDTKLNNVIINLRELEDLDLYPEPLDKQRMKLLIDFGNKKVGSVVARIYQQLSGSKKQFQFSEEELQIKNQIETIITENNLELNSETIKAQFQDGLKPLATVVNLLSFAQDTQAEQEVSSLRQLLQPKPEIIDIFNRLGENFKSGSGALALSQDLSYLDNLVVKREDELRPGEKVLLTEYINNIRQQMIKLQTIYDQVKNKFTAMEQGYTNTSNTQLKDKLGQISQIINTQTTQQTITSTVTNDLNVIIENIRECLSCTREGSNNDTDLTFGDANKFYLYSQTEAGKKGSLSDEVVFVEPITHKDGTQEIAFILDKVYGTNTPIILINQLEAVLKKYGTIKKKFPNIKLSIFVAGSAIQSSGISSDLLIQNLREKNILAQAEENVEVNLIESAAGDHYAEFGGSPRTFGKRIVNGVTIR